MPSTKANALDTHYRLVIACLLAVLTFLALSGHSLASRIVISWDSFALTVIVMAWMVITTKDPYEVRKNAYLHDSSATIMFASVISAATISLVGVGLLLGSVKDLPPASFALHIAASVTAILLSWILIHTLFTLRYASRYYHEAKTLDKQCIDGGLLFPGDQPPNYVDFAYFSFIIGMTCQVADVNIATSQMRILALVHGLIAFIFNTAILAMVINIVAGLL